MSTPTPSRSFRNTRQAEPGTRFEFWDYQAERKGWYIYGLGSVTPDSRRVEPAPGVAIYAFSGAMVAPPANAPAQGPPPGGLPPAADPVDLATGLFVYSKTDLLLPDVLPIKLTRTYRPQDPQSRPFGRGTTHPYEMWLVGNTAPWTWADVVLPDGGRVHYERTSPGTSFIDAEYEHTSTPTVFYKSRIKYNTAIIGWELTLKDGTVYVFGDVAPLQAIRDRYGNTLTLTREFGAQSGKILKITSSHGRWIDFTYDSSGRISQARDNAGRTVGYTYDTSGRLWKVTDPAGGVTEYTYDASHRMLTIKDPRGIVFLTNEYDAGDRVTRQTLADGATYQFAYTIDGGTGKIAQADLTDPRGFVRRVTFNAAGYPVTDTRALGTAVAQTTTWTRDATSNRVVSMNDALNRRTDYAYDALGNVLTETRLAGTPGAVTTTFTYEATYNRVASITDPLTHTTTFGYDSAGNLTTVTNPLGHQTTFSYNVAGQPLTITTPAGTTTLAYDQGDLVSVTDPTGQTTTRFVDNVGRLVATTSPLGQRTQYDYDPLNRMTKITDAIGGLTQFTYDPNGSLLSVTDARSNATTYAYNNMDRLQTRTDPLLRAESYGYDNNGNLATFTDRKSQATSRTYDALDRLTQITYADSSTTAYTWDAGNRLTQITDSLSGTISRTYDGLDRLTQEATPQGAVSYTYDAAGRRTSMTVAGQPTVTYAYDSADHLTSITQGSSVAGFTYDSSGRRTGLTLPNGVTTDYTYDAASRLTGLTYRNGPTLLGDLTYAYDAAGNRRQVGGTWARTGLPQPVASAAYDAANRQVAFGGQTLAYDLNGNLTGDGSVTYTWNARDQLAAISGGVTASFNYDSIGRRTRKTINGMAKDFVYDQLNPVQETPTGSVTNLLLGLGIDEYFARSDVSGTRILLMDGLGSTVALTDSTGAVQTEYMYEPFGAAVVTGTPTGNPFQYTGRENDEAGLYYYRARYYHPRLQRFISEDPVGFSGGPNFYAYVLNNPTNLVDPFGERWFMPRPSTGGMRGPQPRSTPMRESPPPPFRPKPAPLPPKEILPNWETAPWYLNLLRLIGEIFKPPASGAGAYPPVTNQAGGPPSPEPPKTKSGDPGDDDCPSPSILEDMYGVVTRGCA